MSRVPFSVASLDGDLWRSNFAHVRVVDVTDDYTLMMPPLPSECYPILDERWIPVFTMVGLPDASLLDGYLYDWHESPSDPDTFWIVGVVREELATLAI